MIGEIGEVVFAVQVGGAQIDPEPAGNAAVLAARAAIGARRADFLGGRDTAHLHVGIDQRVEGARHLRLDPLDPLGDEIHDLGAARIALGEFVARVLRQRLHALSHRSAGVADAAQDRVHARMQRIEFVEPLPVDFVGGEPRGGARAQGPAVELVAARTCRYPRSVAGHRAFGAQFLELPRQRLGNRTRFEYRRAIGMAFGHAHRLQLAAQIGGEQLALARACDRLLHLPDRLVEQEGRRHHAHAAGLADPRQFAIEGGGHCLHPLDIGIGIVAVLDLVVRLHEPRQREIFADVLDHDIGRGAPIADGRVAIGQGEAVEREVVGAFDHVEAGQRLAVEPLARESAHALQILPQRRRICVLSCRRLVLQPGAQIGMTAGVDAQRGGAFGFVFEQIVADHFEQALCADRARLRYGFGARACGASGERERGRGAEPGKGLATGEGDAGLGHVRGCAMRAQACQIPRGFGGVVVICRRG